MSPLATSRRTFLGLTALAAGTAIGRTSRRSSANPTAAIDALIAQAMAKSPVPGIAVLIEQHGQVLCRKGYGWADLENRVPMTADHVFHIGSITKSMTSLCLMRLVTEGQVSLDDPISRYFADLPARTGLIKVRNLLNHTSGLVNYTDVPDFPGDSQRPFTRDDIVQWFKQRPLLFAPGSCWSYCNSGLYLAGLIIEKVSGRSFDQYIQTTVFDPFGMSRSSMSGWQPVISQRACGYRGKDPGKFENAPRFDPLAAFSAGGVMTTVDDLLEYRKAVFGANSRIPSDLRRLLLERDRLTNGVVVPYMLGCLVSSEFEGHQKLAHSGDINGFGSQYSYYPDDDTTLIVLTNREGGLVPPVSIEQKLARTVLGLAQPSIADRPLDRDATGKFSGEFELFDFFYGFDRLGFVADANRLSVRVGGIHADGPLLPLKWQGGGDFVSALDDEQRLAFDPSGSSLVLHYYGGQFTARRSVA
jgi:D-alanyl-D-alanine carboxypeptidase